MKIIDAHIHFSNIKSFHDVSQKSNVDYSLNGYKNEFQNIQTIGMGLTEHKQPFPDQYSTNPMTLDLDINPDTMYTCLGINPLMPFDKESLRKQVTKNVVGFKIYAGYYHYHVHDEIYTPVYELCEELNLPVVIHSGDTFSEKGLLKYSHPLEIDELAVKFRNVNFIVAHFGDPWVMTTAEIAAKNKNVYIDLSGLIVGDKPEVDHFTNEDFMYHIRRGIVYLDNYKKLLYGSDWPLVNTKHYIEFIKKLIPKEHWEDVFYNNAKNLFRL